MGGSCDWEANSIGKFLGGGNSCDDDGLFGKFMMVFKKGKIMFFQIIYTFIFARIEGFGFEIENNNFFD